MFYEGFTLNANTMASNATGFTYAVNAPYNGPIARFSASGGYDMWLHATYGAGNRLSFRTRNGDLATADPASGMNPWFEILHTGIMAGLNVAFNSVSSESFNKVNGGALMTGDENFTVLRDAGGRPAIYLGGRGGVGTDGMTGVLGDATNYYDNNNHFFRNRGAQLHSTLNANGFITPRVTANTGGPSFVANSTAGTPAATLTYLSFQQLNTERGWVGFGNGNNGLFQVNNTIGPIFINASANIELLSGGAVRAIINSAGITATDFILSSDERLKSHIVPLTNALDRLLTIRGVRYEMNGRTEVGVIAQAVRQVLPEAVTENADGFLGVAYDRLVPLLLESVRELYHRIEVLERRRAH
jgi:hypothetical protein